MGETVSFTFEDLGVLGDLIWPPDSDRLFQKDEIERVVYLGSGSYDQDEFPFYFFFLLKDGRYGAVVGQFCPTQNSFLKGPIFYTAGTWRGIVESAGRWPEAPLNEKNLQKLLGMEPA